MKHVGMRRLLTAAQEERRRQVIGLRQGGMTYEAIAAQVGLSPTEVLNICHRYAKRGAARGADHRHLPGALGVHGAEAAAAGL
jgi:transposase